MNTSSVQSRYICIWALNLALLILLSSSFFYDKITIEAFVPYNSLSSSTTRSPTTTISVAVGKDNDSVVVVTLTREDGKNDKLRKKIEEDRELMNQVDVLEMPCIEHADGCDYESLAPTLLSQRWDYIAITSPEAAKVLASAWDVIRNDPLPVVAVGKATEARLRDSDIPVAFVPTKATAKTLAAELELVSGKSSTNVLYPASAKAKTTLQDGLTERGFTVTRLNTYDTITATWGDDEKKSSDKVQVACFASPSSIKGWLKNTQNNTRVLAACIGETSATACKELGWEENQIFFPENPGLDGWVEAIHKAIEVSKKESYTV
ncbi:MAG: uroporphyrinogen-III synthase [Bacillariaceae sp.]|jgi:uroporphyrinogen-III synthase